MDLNMSTKQAGQTFNQTKRKSLTLEARHSISIEISNQIRAKLRPRIFIPRAPSSNIKKHLKKDKQTDFSKKCQTQIEEHFRNFKGTYAKRTSCDRNYKTMENHKKSLFQKKHQNIKILRKNMKKFTKKLEKPLDIKLQQNHYKSSKTVTAKENAINNWGHFKTIANENLKDSPKYEYLTDGEIIFMDDLLTLNSPMSVKEEKNANYVQNLDAKVTEVSKQPAEKNSLEFVDNINDNSKNVPIKNDTNSKQSYVRKPIEENCENPGLKSSTALISQEISMSLDDRNLQENSKKPTKSACERNLNLSNMSKTNQPAVVTVPNTSNNTKSNEISSLKKAYSIQKNPLESNIYTATTAIADFQDAVRSSISPIYDCSLVDKAINENLIDLENCMEKFSKYVLQCYNDVAEMEWKTNNCMEYLRKKDMDRKKQNSLHISSQNPQKYTEETTDAFLTTININVEKTPTVSSTFNVSDRLYPQPDMDNLKSKNSVEVIYNSSLNQANTKLGEVNTQTKRNMEIQKRNESFSRIRRKVVATILNTDFSVSNNNQTLMRQDTINNNETDYLKSTNLYTSPYNSIYTQAQNHYNSLIPPNPLSSQAITTYGSSIAGQVLTNSPVTLTTCSNYSHATENGNSGRIPLSESPRTHIYPLRQNLYREPNNVVIENPNSFRCQNFHRGVPYLQNHYIYQSTEPITNNSQPSFVTKNLPAWDNIKMRNY